MEVEVNGFRRAPVSETRAVAKAKMQHEQLKAKIAKDHQRIADEHAKIAEEHAKLAEQEKKEEELAKKAY